MKVELLVCVVFFVASVFSEEETAEKVEKAQVCEPGKSFKKECNTCWCSTNGLDFACTRKSCPDPTTVPQNNANRRKRGINESCTPKSTFQKDCNKCVCSEDGSKAVCTLKKCPQKNTKNKRAAKQICEPGKRFKDDCNTCHCSADGTRASCTQMACPPRKDA